MILSSHAVVGAGLASLTPAHPATAFVVGFVSHFALDAIPHADYPIRSGSVDPEIGAPMTLDAALVWDVLTIGFDGLFGLLVAVFLFSSPMSHWAILLGAVGAMLPDPLQFVYAHFPHEPLRMLQRLHRWAHTETPLQCTILALGAQAGFVALVVGLVISISHGAFTPALAMVRMVN